LRVVEDSKSYYFFQNIVIVLLQLIFTLFGDLLSLTMDVTEMTDGQGNLPLNQQLMIAAEILYEGLFKRSGVNSIFYFGSRRF
jgi:hypothetical protein